MPWTPEQKRRWQLEWIAARRQEWFAVNGPCTWCGTWDDLQVDHIDPATKVSHNVWSWRRERREAELAKCQVLCHPCHIIKTSGQSLSGETNPAAHLTESAVAFIRASDEPLRALAKRFGVSPNTVWLARTYQTWNGTQRALFENQVPRA